MDLVCFGQQNWDYCWTGKQQLMSRLAARGHRVLYIDPDSVEDVTGLADTWRSLAPVSTRFGLREVADGLLIHTHRHAPPLGWRVNQRRRSHLLRALVRRLEFDRAPMVALHPKVVPLIEAVPPAPLVYYAVDEATAFPSMDPGTRRLFTEQEDWLLARAGVALAVSPRLVARFARTQPRTYLLENGADVAHFAPERLANCAPDPLVGSLPRPRVVFVGQVDERIDQDLVAAIATARPSWHIVLAGRQKTGVDFSALAALSNVHLAGYRPYERLPGVLREADACIVPYRSNDLTNACNPLKVFEYLATGHPVVSTPLEGLGVCRSVISVAGDAAGFIEALDAALAKPDAGRADRLALASANSWDMRVDELERRLDEAVAVHRSAGGPVTSFRRASSGKIHRRRSEPPIPRTEHLSVRARSAMRVLNAVGRLYHLGRVIARLGSGEKGVRVRRILVTRRSRLGDLVVFLPALEALRKAYPEARIVFASQPGCPATLVLGRKGVVDEVRVLDFLDSPNIGERIRGALSLFAEGFDLVLCGEGFFLMREAYYSGAPYRVGHSNGHPVQALNSHVLPFDATRHEADNNLAIVESLTGSTLRGMAPHLVLTDAGTRIKAEQLLSEHGIHQGVPLLAIHPGAQKPSRRWPADRFGGVATHVLRKHPNLRVVLTGSPDERALADHVLGEVAQDVRSRVSNVAGITDLRGLSGVLEASTALLCNDTGVMHLARATGVPLVAVLGPEDDRRWGPYPDGAAPVEALRHEVPCAPCIRWDCSELFCLRSLSVAEVADAVDRALARGHDGDGRLQVTRSRESWETLAASGFELPLVSVVLGTGSWAGTTDFQQELAETLLAVQAQRYPAIDLVAVLPDGMSMPEASGLRRLEPRIVPVPSDADDVWSAALVVSRGAFIAPIAPGIRWTPGKIGADVAYLQRHPNAELSSSGLPAGSEHARHFGFSTFRRPAFERWIEHGRWTHDAPSVSGTPTATASNPV